MRNLVRRADQKQERLLMCRNLPVEAGGGCVRRLTLMALLVCVTLALSVCCYGQAAANKVPVVDTYNVVDTFDSAHPLEIPVYIDEGMTLHDIRVTAIGMRYRTYAAVDIADCSHYHGVDLPHHKHELEGALQGTFTDSALTNISINNHWMLESEETGGSIHHVVTDPQHRHYFEYLYPHTMTEAGGGCHATTSEELPHSHGLIYGIYDDISADGLPKGVDLWFSDSDDRSNYVKVADLTEPPPRVDEFELCEGVTLLATGSGWKWIRLTTTTRGRASVHIVIRGYMEGWAD